MRTLDQINDKIRQRQAVVETAEAFKVRVLETDRKSVV